MRENTDQKNQRSEEECICKSILITEKISYNLCNRTVFCHLEILKDSIMLQNLHINSTEMVISKDFPREFCEIIKNTCESSVSDRIE